MRKLALFACLGVLLAGSPALASTIVTFDEVPNQIVPLSGSSLTVSGVTFNFTPGFDPGDPNAYYNSTDGPDQHVDATLFLDDNTLEGSAYGTLSLMFASPINYLQFGLGLDTTDALTPGFTIQLLNGVTPILFLPVNTAPQGGSYVFSETQYTYSGAPVTQAILNFDATSGDCSVIPSSGRCAGGRFAMDNLSYDPVPGPPAPVPEPASLTLLGIGAAGLRFLRRRQN